MEKKKMNNNNNCSKICKICNRCFASGKAIGGHMRSHFAKLPIPPKPTEKTPAVTDHEPSEISVVGVYGGSSSTQQPPLSPSSPTIDPKMNSPIVQNFRSLNQDFAVVVPNANDDQGSESEQSHLTSKRSKRRRKIGDTTKAAMSPKTKVDDGEPKQTSLMFNSLSPVTEAARSLMLLSKDKWPEGKELMMKKKQVKKEDDKEDLDSGICFRGGKFECEVCNKVFGSYQALGGHKASHKKLFKNDYELKEDGEFDEENGDDSNNRAIKNDVLEDIKVFKCPYCSKMFESGQGLGRHKKVHFSNSMKSGVSFIDLNLPASVEDGEEKSQIPSSSKCNKDY